MTDGQRNGWTPALLNDPHFGDSGIIMQPFHQHNVYSQAFLHQTITNQTYFASDTTASFVRCLLRSSRGTSFKAYSLRSHRYISTVNKHRHISVTQFKTSIIHCYHTVKPALQLTNGKSVVNSHCYQ